MIIPNHKTIYNKVAEKMGLDVELVEKIGQHTWSDLNKRIANFENREIYVYKLGVFKFRKIKGEQYLKHLKKSIALIDGNPVLSEEEREDAKIRVRNKIDTLQKLINEWEDIIQQRKKFKDEQATRHLQQQGVNLGRTEEQDIQEGSYRSDL